LLSLVGGGISTYTNALSLIRCPAFLLLSLIAVGKSERTANEFVNVVSFVRFQCCVIS
jgi:hypothetical protein